MAPMFEIYNLYVASKNLLDSITKEVFLEKGIDEINALEKAVKAVGSRFDAELAAANKSLQERNDRHN